MNTQTGWPARLTRTIAAQVKRTRTERKLSAQQLSDACAKLGLEMPRSVLADLENGRRAHVSVAELLVLARALDVPPLLLVFPVGTDEETEILPGADRAPFRGAQWFTGERPFPGPDDADYLDDIASDWGYASGSPLWLYRSHNAAETGEREALRRAAGWEAQAAGAGGDSMAVGMASVLREQADTRHRAAEDARRRAKELGWLPPG